MKLDLSDTRFCLEVRAGDLKHTTTSKKNQNLEIWKLSCSKFELRAQPHLLLLVLYPYGRLFHETDFTGHCRDSAKPRTSTTSPTSRYLAKRSSRSLTFPRTGLSISHWSTRQTDSSLCRRSRCLAIKPRPIHREGRNLSGYCPLAPKQIIDRATEDDLL